MRIFHVSEESNITEFIPRLPVRKDLNQSVGLVWTIDEKHLPNFLTPRNCPRVCFTKNSKTTIVDIDRYMGKEVNHVVVIEDEWMERLKNTVLYLYEFNLNDFSLQDEVAGYYVSTKTVKPIKKITVTNLASELASRGVELRTVGNLNPIANDIKNSSFDWSLCRMAYAKK